VKPLLVGEVNPYGSDPEFDLYPSPPRSAGGRMCRLILGMDTDAYVELYDRVNLCIGRWSAPEAGERAARIVRINPSGSIVLLGARVCGAFGFPYLPYSTIGRFTLLPHPSGRSRAWNEPGAYDRARKALWDAGCPTGSGKTSCCMPAEGR